MSNWDGAMRHPPEARSAAVAGHGAARARPLLLAGLAEPERTALAEALELTAHAVACVDEVEALVTRARALRPPIVILGLHRPGFDSFRALRRLRAEGLDMPVLVCARAGAEVDRILAFRLGADGIVSLPCGTLELLARVEAMLRRQRAHPLPEPPRTLLRVGALEIDLAARTVRRAGTAIELRPRVFDLLVALARHRGAAVSRRDLLRDVWRHEPGVGARTVDMHVAHLRRLLGEDGTIVTVRKLGYRLEG
ncbi:MAG TPA: response regulator transcription factor [Gemmatimonadaceae bacterium]|nr:response regulator transcription factor [Gemmatimonadaceae bacterium]